MKTAKGTINQTSNGVGESFRVLYYGSAAAGSVPFMWESQPGTPKHALTESSLPPLTPPPSYHQRSQTYNSPMQLINHRRYSTKRSGGFLRKFFINETTGTGTTSFSTSCSSSSSMLLHSWQSTPMSKTEVRRMMKFGLEDGCGKEEHAGGGGSSPAPELCLGGGFKKVYRINKMKKVIQWFVCHGNTK